MKKVFLILFASMAILACNTQQKEGATGEKGAIFLTEFDTPYGTPPFDRITFEDYKPAFMAGMKQQTEEVNAIINNPEEPTFENTIEALDNSGAILTRVSRVFYGIRGANTNDSIRALAEELSPILSEHNDNIYLNEQLFARIKAIHDDTASMNLTTEQYRLLDEYYKSFVRSGIMLSENDKSRLREINKELSGLTLRFGNNLLNETNSYKLVIDNEEDLAGLPEAVKATAASAAKAAGEEGNNGVIIIKRKIKKQTK
jgi:peptidyl-dipeptidase Dcp